MIIEKNVKIDVDERPIVIEALKNFREFLKKECSAETYAEEVDKVLQLYEIKVYFNEK